MSTEVLRRNDMTKWTAQEQSVWNAIQAVGGLPATPGTAEALRMLQRVREIVHDYCDNLHATPQPVAMLHNIQLMTEATRPTGARDRALRLIDLLRHELQEAFERGGR
jgi:hypothetical protein